MSRNRLMATALFLALLAGVALWHGTRGDAPGEFALLTEAEIASFPPFSEQEIAELGTSTPSNVPTDVPAEMPIKARALTVTQASGPFINVSAPTGFALKSPVNFDIRVEPRDGISVDMRSLRIEYKIGPVWVNLTQRVMRQAKINGTRFVARGAQLPPGNHALRLTVRDSNARKTQALVTFSVRQ